MTTPRPPTPPARERTAARGAPRRQRGHRDPLTRPHPTARFSARHLAALATRLTERDRWLIAMLHEHRVLTTHAIARMAFTSDHRARRRLLQLHSWDVLERFAPRLPVGAAPLHYVLGPAGAAVLAAQHGLPLTALRYRRDDALAIAHHHTLAHTVAVNDLFAHLVHHTLHPRARMRLDCWWSEARCRRVLDYVRPDAYGRLTTPTETRTHPDTDPRVFEWFLELDFGTATLDTLAAKLDRYARLAAATRPRPLLIWLPTPARDAHARTRLTRARDGIDPRLLPMATSTAAIAALPRPGPSHTGRTGTGPTDTGSEETGQVGQAVLGPADPVWLPLGSAEAGGRVDLAALARLWPARPGTTLAAETGIPADADAAAVDAFADAEDIGPRALGAPRPIPPNVAHRVAPHGRR
jgi:hypothetical protein